VSKSFVLLEVRYLLYHAVNHAKNRADNEEDAEDEDRKTGRGLHSFSRTSILPMNQLSSSQRFTTDRSTLCLSGAGGIVPPYGLPVALQTTW
jgi:hypothetical protein